MKLNPQDYIIKFMLKGFSIKKISRKARVSHPTIHRIQVGETLFPRIDTADKLQEIYKKNGDLGGGLK